MKGTSAIATCDGTPPKNELTYLLKRAGWQAISIYLIEVVPFQVTFVHS